MHIDCTLKNDLFKGRAHGLFIFSLLVLIPVDSIYLLNEQMNGQMKKWMKL